MEHMKGRKKVREKAVAEYLGGDVSYRELEGRYGIASGTLHRWVKEHLGGKGPEGREADGIEAIERVVSGLAVGRGEMPQDVKKLQRELKEARLYNELLNAMIDIAEEQMGIPIRKKSGAKR